MSAFPKRLDRIAGPDLQAADAAQRILDQLTKPPGSLGRLEELACRIASITGQCPPRVDHPVIFTLAGDHGVVSEGVSAYPQIVTVQMVDNLLRGGAAVNVLARSVGARVVVADLGVAGPIAGHPNLRSRRVAAGTRNMAHGPAMTRDELHAALTHGAELVDEECAHGLDLVATGEMGIGNTTAATAITAALTGASVDEVTGTGTGISEDGRRHKVAVIERALAINRPDRDDPLDVLAKVGGFEIAGLAGVVLGAAARRLPVALDGFIAGAAALAAVRIKPEVQSYLIAAHRSAERGHHRLLEALGLTPYLDLGMRLGEGTGAALCIGLVRAAIAILTGMATFESAGVSRARPAER